MKKDRRLLVDADGRKQLPLPRIPVTIKDVESVVKARGKRGATRREIAVLLDRSVHPALIEKINALVERAVFEVEVIEYGNKARGYKYHYNENADEGFST